MAIFEASEDDYRDKLEQIKLQKKDNLKKLKAVTRCLERDGSMLDAELEYRIPVGNMDDLTAVVRDKVPGNLQRMQNEEVASKVILKAIADEFFHVSKVKTNTAEVDASDYGAMDVRAEEFIQKRVKQIIETMERMGIDADRLTEYSIDVLSEVFSFRVFYWN